MRAKQFIRKINEAADESSVITSEVIKLISDGHTEVSPDVITAKVSAALGRPFMLKDLVSANNASPELQHYIDSINPSKIKFSTDILTVKNQDPMKEKQAAQDGVAKMAARAGSRPRLGESKLTEGTGIGDLVKFKQPYEHKGQEYLYGHVTGFSLNPDKLGVGMGHGHTAATPFMGAEAKGLVVDLKRTPYHSADDYYGKVTVPLDSFVKLGSALGGGAVQNEIWKFNKIYGFPKPGADIDYSKILGSEEVSEGWGGSGDRVRLPDEPANYYHGNGELQKEYNELYAKLVPDMGAADTIEGEVLRAASKIVYRHYNDGDEFNAASFSQLVPYIGKVTSYDDLAHKATEFALKANGEYHPNPGWDSLDVMEYGPEFDDDEYDDDYDEDEYGEYDDEVEEGWGADAANARHAQQQSDWDKTLEKYKDDPVMTKRLQHLRSWKADYAEKAAQAGEYVAHGRGYKFPGEDIKENSMTMPQSKEHAAQMRQDLEAMQREPSVMKSIAQGDHELEQAIMRRLAGLSEQSKGL